MRLVRFGYQELVDRPGEWRILPFDLQQINLIVGKNSSGKSRTLNVMSAFSRTILGNERLNDGDFHAEFEHSGSRYIYKLTIMDKAVAAETLTVDNNTLINRADGFLWSSFDNRQTRFELQPDQIAANVKFDLIQTPYLKPLRDWASSVFHFHFGTTLGQFHLGVVIPESKNEINLKDENATSRILHHAIELHGDRFKDAVIRDMRGLGYDISDVGICNMSTVTAEPNIGPLKGLYVTEGGVGHNVEQIVMSSGMFRALAIIIHTNLGLFSEHANMILIDDIGEGLDFQRSSALVSSLVEKVKGTNIQIVMTSNDKFIMNAVDIEYWTVLSRRGFNVRAHNRHNSRDAFEDFRFTGLQNFDFFSMELATEG